MSVRQCVAMTIECADVHFHGLVYRLAGLQETFCTYEYHFELVRAAFSSCGLSADVCAYMCLNILSGSGRLCELLRGA